MKPVPNVFDILAVIFSILLSVRKMDVSRREASEFPSVDPEKFNAWRVFATTVYSQGSIACFLKLGLELAFTTLVASHVSWNLVRLIGGSIDLTWLGFMVFTWIRSSRVNRERKALGLDLR